MIFSFKTFVDELRENPEKKEVVEKYEKYYGAITGEINDQQWYTDYVGSFSVVPFRVPEELKNDFDRALLMQLVGASFSSDGILDTETDDAPEFLISVQSGEQIVVKKVSELWWFQILRLYEIYAEEQMNLHILIAEDEKEKEAIVAQRDSRSKRRQIVIDNLEKDIMQKQAEVEKKEQLTDLYDQL
jgi:hypothetical protein